MDNNNLNDHVNLFKNQTGLTPEDYNMLLDEKSTEWKANNERCLDYLLKWIDEGKPIKQRFDKNSELFLKDGERFYPVYNPNLAGCKDLPTNWFYTSYDNLISVNCNSKGNLNKVYWLPPKEQFLMRNGKIVYDANIPKIDIRGRQGFANPITNANRTMKHYQLGGLILNRDVILPDAIKMLEMFQSYAFGGRGDKFNLNCHHPLSLYDNPECRYQHDNSQILTVYCHIDILHLVSRMYENGKDVAALTDQLATMLTNGMENLFGVRTQLPLYLVYGKRYGLYKTYPADLIAGDQVLVIR